MKYKGKYVYSFSKTCARCENRYVVGRKNKSLFRCPKDKFLRRQWIKFLMQDLENTIPDKEKFISLRNKIQFLYVCEDHFLPTDFTKSGTRIKYGSIPTVVNKFSVEEDKLLTDLPEPELELEVVCSNTELQNLPKLYDQNKVLYKEIKTEPTDSNEVNATKNCREPVAPSQNQNQNLAPNTYLPFAPNTYLPIGETFIKQEIIDEEEQTFNNLESDHDYSVAESSEPIQKDFAEQCLEYALEYLKQQGDINFSDDITNISNLLEKLKK